MRNPPRKHSQKLVKLLSTKDGKEIPDDLRQWHLVDREALFCTGERYKDNEQSHEIKFISRAGITCEECIERIRIIKQIKL